MQRFFLVSHMLNYSRSNMGALIKILVRLYIRIIHPNKIFRFFHFLIYNKTMPKIKVGGKTVKLPYANKGGKIPKYGKGGMSMAPKMKPPRRISPR